MPTGIYIHKPCSEETKKKISLARKGTNTGKTYEQIMGKKQALITRKKKSISMLGKNKNKPSIFKGKTYEEIYGKEKSAKLRYKKGLKLKGRIMSQEAKRKMRLARLKAIEVNGKVWPSYNKEACEFFKSFDEKNNTRGQYAMYGGGEYRIDKLGFWVDYINFDKKLIMEYDERYHYDKDGNLRKKDIIRQQEIQEHFPDFKFKRICDFEMKFT